MSSFGSGAGIRIGQGLDFGLGSWVWNVRWFGFCFGLWFSKLRVQKLLVNFPFWLFWLVGSMDFAMCFGSVLLMFGFPGLGLWFRMIDGLVLALGWVCQSCG